MKLTEAPPSTLDQHVGQSVDRRIIERAHASQRPARRVHRREGVSVAITTA